MISDDLSTFYGQESSIPPMLQLLACLQFFARGHFQCVTCTADLLDISQSSISRSVDKVANANAARHQEFINFPTPNTIHVPTAKYKFSQICGLPK